jgi:hypothetical protein
MESTALSSQTSIQRQKAFALLKGNCPKPRPALTLMGEEYIVDRHGA